MGEKIMNDLGMAIGYTAIFIGTYEIVSFGFNRCAEIIIAGEGVLDKAWDKIRNK